MSISSRTKNFINLTLQTITPHGNASSKSADTVYLASTDGFVTTYGNGTIYSDTSATPTTVVATGSTSAGAPCMCAPILRGYYWKASSGLTVWWTPVGS